MASVDMADLMRDDAGDLGIVLCQRDEFVKQNDDASGQCKRVRPDAIARTKLQTKRHAFACDPFEDKKSPAKLLAASVTQVRRSEGNAVERGQRLVAKSPFERGADSGGDQSSRQRHSVDETAQDDRHENDQRSRGVSAASLQTVDQGACLFS